MNKLNKKIISFVLLFSICLLVNVSCAFILEANVDYTNSSPTQNTISSFANYSSSSINTICMNYYNDSSNSEYISAFNNMISAFSAEGYDRYFIESYKSTAGIDDINAFFFPSTVDVCINPVNNSVYFCFDNSEPVIHWKGTVSRLYKLTASKSVIYGFSFYSANPFYTNVSIKQLIPSNQNYYFYWDGGTYYYKSETDKPEEPIMPTNSEIASVVQSFYDSDLYKNNTNFKDFMVVYSFATGNYSIIGTDNHLLQEIYYDGAKPSNEDFSYPDTWWRFYNYFGNVQNFFYGWDYWLYSTYKENDVFLPIQYNGVGKINDLFELKFSAQNIIVYSSYEYKVYEFYPPETEDDSNQVTETTVPGNEYTYNEELNPTDSEYSPIQNYIPANPSQTILGDVDFSEINKTFEENKDILNIENASWLFTANNKLVGYFIGFLSLLIVFLIISRILGG